MLSGDMEPEHRSELGKFDIVYTTNQNQSSNILNKKMKFSIKYFFSTCNQIRGFLRIWSHLLKKSLMENLTFCAMIM